MATQNKIQVFPEKEPVFVDIKVGKELTKYRAWIGHYFVKGITEGSADEVKAVVRRMAEARAEPVEEIKALLEVVADYVATHSQTGLTDIAVKMGRHFHFGEKMVVMVKAEYLNRYYGGSWWVEVRVMFKGDDGLKALSKHIVSRIVEFGVAIDRDRLYNMLYEAARIAFNAYIHSGQYA